MATSGHSLTRSSNAHPIGSSDAPSEDPMAMQEKEDNGYKLLIRLGGLYKRLTPAIFMLLEFRETSYTLKNTSKPTQVLSDQILRFSTNFVSKSARLAQVSV